MLNGRMSIIWNITWVIDFYVINTIKCKESVHLSVCPQFTLEWLKLYH